MSNRIDRFECNNRMSQVIKLENHIETSGIVANCLETDILSQTQSVLDQLDKKLELVGADRNNLIRVQIWLANMDDFDGMNSIYEKWFEGCQKPVRACVGAQLADSRYRIEIQASAVI